jgi:hypothetical protein
MSELIISHIDQLVVTLKNELQDEWNNKKLDKDQLENLREGMGGGLESIIGDNHRINLSEQKFLAIIHKAFTGNFGFVPSD